MGDGRGGAKQAAVEGVERRSFGLVGDKNGAVDVDGADQVATKALRGVSMEETGVFIPFHHSAELPALLPVRRTSEDQRLQLRSAHRAETNLEGGEGTTFFKEIKKVNHELTIIFKFGVESVGAFPNLSSRAEGFETSCNVSSRIVLQAGGVPGWEGGGEEKGVQKPEVFEPKTR